MAERIKDIKRMEIPKEKMKQDNLDELLDVLSENKEAMLETVRFFSLLHESGNLAMMNAMVAKQEHIMGNLAFEANNKPNSTILHNFTRLIEFLGMLNLEGIDELTTRYTRKQKEEGTEVPSVEDVGFIKLIKTLKDPEVSRGVYIMLQILRGIGHGPSDEKK
ncbi:DUF1641 domain-containing protein [Fictibacillus enclensis]|uniref:DUF1641 domain-containing protein n=1 Tax=Fictibacillus enclensis TaxID=1017270 RepID=UPI0025A0AE35|nr:DUF1641 domain-containing protein [Fictibacillus enclensis]MDM5340683.1 DUF1641 domain-containing protein [Fictibacillus enclensis]